MMATTTTRTVAVAVDAEPATTSSLTAETWAQIEAISDQVRRALECPVCLTLATVMASLCANGHAVCHTCVVKLWSRDTTQHCPMCRSPMDLRASTAMTVKLTEFTERVRLACDYRRFGCHRLYFVRDILEHERVCAYKPNVECLASTCQWLGTYDQLQEHVLHAHADVFVEATKNSLSVDNTNLIATKQRRTYLVRSPAGMFWVVLTRVRRGYVRTGVFVVENSKPPTADPAGSQTFGSAAASTHKYRYRVKSIDPERRPRTRVVIKWVGQSSTLSEDLRGGKRGAAEAYAVIKSTTGGMQFSWFPHLVETG